MSYNEGIISLLATNSQKAPKLIGQNYFKINFGDHFCHKYKVKFAKK